MTKSPWGRDCAFMLLLLCLAQGLWPSPAWSEACSGGRSGGYACENASVLARLTLGQISGRPSGANDIWGHRDLNSDREYALLGLTNGLVVVDVTDPLTPWEVQFVPGQQTNWRDLKVYQYFDQIRSRWQAYAYVTADQANERLVVIDLSGLPNSVRLAGRETDESRAHNVLVANLEPGTNLALEGREAVLLTSGSSLGGGALRGYSLADPMHPALVHQFTGHSHDVATVLIDDGRSAQCPGSDGGCVLAADASEDDLQLWDITNVSSPSLLASVTYGGMGYVHSAAFSDDGRFMAVQDELDEFELGMRTTARVFDLADLAAPVLVGTWSGPTGAIDHNGFIRGDRLYLSNYTRGLTILDMANPAVPAQAGFLDTYPSNDATAFSGAWGIYPYLPSGNMLLSDIQGGLFVLRDESRSGAPGAVAFVAAAVQGEEGGVVSVEVVRRGPALAAGSIHFETLPGSAGVEDYLPVSGELNWAAGESGSKFIDLALAADGQVEGMERLLIRLSSPAGEATLDWPSLASVFVSEPGAQARVGFLDTSLVLSAGKSKAVAVVRRSGSAAGAVSVDYAVASPLLAASGAASVTGTLEWTGGDGAARSIALDLDGLVDANNREFSVNLSNPTGAIVDGETLAVTVQDTPLLPGGGGGGSAAWLAALLALGALRRLRQR